MYDTAITATLAIGVERVCKSRLLCRVDGQAVVVLDLNPSNDVGAFEGVERRKPSGGVFVALGLVEVVCDGDQLRLSEVVGELLAAICCPITGSTDPGFLQRNYVVDVEVGSQGSGHTVVG